MTSTPSTERIRDLNDAYRTGQRMADWHVTDGVEARGILFMAQAMEAVRNFDGFTPDNDPYGEHDFGSFDLAGAKLFWKIDYYNRDLSGGSEDASDAQKTRRVMTIMLASEY